jgi:hypothetical protein
MIKSKLISSLIRLNKALAPTIILLMVFATHSYADDTEVPYDPQLNIDLGLGVFHSNQSNSDIGNSSSFNQRVLGKVGYQFIPELEIFSYFGYNSTGQNTFGLGAKVSPIDFISLSVSAGIEDETISYNPDPVDSPTAVYRDNISLKTVSVNIYTNLIKNDQYKLELVSGTTIFLPYSNETYSLSYNARAVLELNLEKKLNDKLTLKTGLFYQNEQHDTYFMTQSQTDIGASIGFRWRIF